MKPQPEPAARQKPGNKTAKGKTPGLRIVIPEGLAFEALELTRTPEGQVQCRWHVIEQICAASGIDIALLRDGPEDNVAGLIIGWYAEHIARGGTPDAVAEDLIRESPVTVYLNEMMRAPKPGNKTAKDKAVGLQRVNVSLDAASIQALRAYGDGELSLGIRRAAKILPRTA